MKKNIIFNSVKAKIFISLSLIVVLMMTLLIFLNTVFYEQFYISHKQSVLKSAYVTINQYLVENKWSDLQEELERIVEKNNFDILIENSDGFNVYNSSNTFLKMNLISLNEKNQIVTGPMQDEHGGIVKTETYEIMQTKDRRTGRNYIMLIGLTENDDNIYLRISLNSVSENVSIANQFFLIVAGITILIASIAIYFITKRITAPILEINEVAEQMAKLNFSKKYTKIGNGYEIDNLGNSINSMSDKLENIIKQLKTTNIELEKDIEEKYKIDEMRKRFISDVSHELKTPIALIQAYGEGLLENEQNYENRKYYTEIILDETSKMDKLVKQLLELMKLEYGKREFNDRKFDISELEDDIIRKSKVILNEKKIEMLFKKTEPIMVFADDFYIEQVFTNYLTNAIKYATPKHGKTKIEVENILNKEENRVRVIVKNTGENLTNTELEQIWERFYKLDESRNRQEGGIGIGLSLVKAIMGNYEGIYGANNIKNGVEFYFELKIMDE